MWNKFWEIVWLTAWYHLFIEMIHPSNKLREKIIFHRRRDIIHIPIVLPRLVRPHRRRGESRRAHNETSPKNSFSVNFCSDCAERTRYKGRESGNEKTTISLILTLSSRIEQKLFVKVIDDQYDLVWTCVSFLWLYCETIYHFAFFWILYDKNMDVFSINFLPDILHSPEYFLIKVWTLVGPT